jgi:hypothetical protein
MTEDRAALVAAVKAACQVRIDDYRASGVRSISLTSDCRYPLCGCKLLPAQVETAIKAHQAVELARWRAELALTREPAVAQESLDATDRAMLPRLMRKAADQIEADGDPVGDIDPSTQLGV